MLKTLFHFSIFVLSTSLICYDQAYVKWDLPNKDMEKLPLNSRSMFLTAWCMIVQTIYHFIAVLNDIKGSNEPSPGKLPAIRKIKDSLFGLAFSSAIYVTIGFWSIYAFGRELIIPKFADKLYPEIVNQIVHTSFSIFIIIELITSRIQYPPRKIGYTIIFIFYLSYVAWFYGIYATIGVWVYPVSVFLNWPLRIFLTVISLGIAFGIYIIGEKINKAIHSEQALNGSLINSKDKSYSNKINGIDNVSNTMNGHNNGVNGINNRIKDLGKTNGATNKINTINKNHHGVSYKISSVSDVINYFNSKISDSDNKKTKVINYYNRVVKRNHVAKDIAYQTDGLRNQETNGFASKINSISNGIKNFTNDTEGIMNGKKKIL